MDLLANERRSFETFHPQTNQVLGVRVSMIIVTVYWYLGTFPRNKLAFSVQAKRKKRNKCSDRREQSV